MRSLAAAILPLTSTLDMESLAYAMLQGGQEYGRWQQDRDRVSRTAPPSPGAGPAVL